jgi:hypothetical protein
MALFRIKKGRKLAVLHWFFSGISLEERRTVLRIRIADFGLIPMQRPTGDTVMTDDLLSKRDVMPSKGRKIVVRFVDADPVHYPIRQMSRNAHRSNGGGLNGQDLFLVKSRRLCKISLRSARGFYSARRP